jgi:hypothetical protein
LAADFSPPKSEKRYEVDGVHGWRNAEVKDFYALTGLPDVQNVDGAGNMTVTIPAKTARIYVETTLNTETMP